MFTAQASKVICEYFLPILSFRCHFNYGRYIPRSVLFRLFVLIRHLAIVKTVSQFPEMAF